jgi:enamine deaminase RidA (YjgF/YER057c/UK114 family)
VDPEARLAELGLDLPAAPRPVASYVPAVVSGNLVFLAGQVPMADGVLLWKGKVGAELDADAGADAARRCALQALAVLRDALGSLGRVRRIVKLSVFVASAPGFSEQPRVANGASDLLAEVFGEAGRHARTAVGVPELPLGAPVEVEVVAEISD